jgi:hypothetical protein
VAPEAERKVPDDVPPVAPPVVEKPMPEIPPTPAQPAEEPADDSPVNLAEDEEYMKRCKQAREYEAALAKLAEPEPKGIKLLTEITELADHLECAYSAKIELLQARPAAGWASCSFDAYGRQYSVSLREKRKDK